MLDSTAILCYNKQENIGEGRRLDLRTGIFFFFNMGHITKVTRLALALMTAAILLRSTFLSSSLFMSVYFAVLFVSLIPAPSDKSMLRLIDRFYSETVKRAGDACELLHYEIVVPFRAFLSTGKYNFCRHIGTSEIYTHAAGAAFVEKSGKRFLVIGTKSLISARPAKFYEIDLNTDPVTIATQPLEEDRVELRITCNAIPRGIVIHAKNDFRYRDFLAAVGDYVKQ